MNEKLILPSHSHIICAFIYNEDWFTAMSPWVQRYYQCVLCQYSWVVVSIFHTIASLGWETRPYKYYFETKVAHFRLWIVRNKTLLHYRNASPVPGTAAADADGGAHDRGPPPPLRPGPRPRPRLQAGPGDGRVRQHAVSQGARTNMRRQVKLDTIFCVL